MANVISGGQLQALGSPAPNLPAGWGNIEVHNGPIGAWGELPRLGQEDPVLMWRTQASVRKVVDYIARAVASTPIKLYSRVSDTDRQRITDHPLVRILAQPADRTTSYRFWHSIIVDLMLYDRWVCVKGPTVDPLRPMSLTRVQSARSKLADDGIGNVSTIWVDGRLKLDPADCLYDHGYAPWNSNGTTPMATLSAILQESREAVEYRRKVWANAGRIPAVITRPADAPQWSDAARDHFVSQWRAYSRGGGQEGATPILQDGMSLSSVQTFSPRDAEDLAGRQLNDAEVASAFHVPPELIGAREGNYSNMVAFREALYGDVLGPLFVQLEQVLNVMLVPDLDDTGSLYAEYDLDSKMRGSFESQAAVLSTSTGAPWLTRAEARARANLPAIEGSDQLVVPLNVLTGGQASPRDSGTQNTPLGGKRRLALVKGRAPDTHEQKAAEVLTKFFERQRAVVLSALGAKATDWWDTARWDNELGGDLYKLAVQTATEVGTATASKLGFTPGDYDVARTLAFLKAVTDRRAADINAATQAAIEDALASDDPLVTPAHVFDVALSMRVASAAIQFVTADSGFGTTEAARQVGGGKAIKTWRVNSGNPRPSHSALDGVSVGIDDVFDNGCSWPGDGGDAAEVAGCSCSCDVEIG